MTFDPHRAWLDHRWLHWLGRADGAVPLPLLFLGALVTTMRSAWSISAVVSPLRRRSVRELSGDEHGLGWLIEHGHRLAGWFAGLVRHRPGRRLAGSANGGVVSLAGLARPVADRSSRDCWASSVSISTLCGARTWPGSRLLRPARLRRPGRLAVLTSPALGGASRPPKRLAAETLVAGLRRPGVRAARSGRHDPASAESCCGPRLHLLGAFVVLVGAALAGEADCATTTRFGWSGWCSAGIAGSAIAAGRRIVACDWMARLFRPEFASRRADRPDADAHRPLRRRHADVRCHHDRALGAWRISAPHARPARACRRRMSRASAAIPARRGGMKTTVA